MRIFAAKLGVHNRRPQPHTVTVEPWADSYVLAPDRELEIIAVGDEATPWFNIVEWDDTTQVYCEDNLDYYVVQDGRRLDNGTDRGSAEGVEKDIAALWPHLARSGG